MLHAKLGMAFVLILAGLLLAGCMQSAVEAAPEAAVTIEPIEGTHLARVTLSENAAVRLAIETEALGGDARERAQRSVVPFSAVVYDADGSTWVYTNPEGLVFVRQAITVVRIDSGVAVLSDGPATGTLVVTIGVAELYGAETGVGGGH